MTASKKLKGLFSQNTGSNAKTDEKIRFCTEEDIVDRNVTELV